MSLFSPLKFSKNVRGIKKNPALKGTLNYPLGSRKARLQGRSTWFCIWVIVYILSIRIQRFRPTRHPWKNSYNWRKLDFSRWTVITQRGILMMSHQRNEHMQNHRLKVEQASYYKRILWSLLTTMFVHSILATMRVFKVHFSPLP